MADRFRFYLRVRYSECDAQSVVFNARYGDYVGVATTEFLRAMGPDANLINGDHEYQLVKQTLEWKFPARYDQVLELRVSVRHVGNTSFTIGTEFRVAGEERVITSVETVCVLVDAASLTKVSLPSALRAALEHGAPGVVIDHGGFLGTPVSRGQLPPP